MRYALIGCGRISPNHIAAAKNCGLEIVGLCDTDQSSIDDKILKFDLAGVHTYTDYHEMTAKEQPDLVAICTDSGKHAQIALDCIRAGINTIIEKPIALSISDARDIIVESKKLDIKVTVCHQNRFNKSIRKIHEAMDKRRFGKLYYGVANVRWARDREYYERASWRGTWEMDGGALMNQCIHNIDILRWLMGDDIIEVVGMTDKLKHDYIEAEDMGIALVKFSNGSYGVIEGTTNIYPKNLEETLYIFGEKGTAKAGGISLNKIEEWRFSDMLDDRDTIIDSFSEEVPNIYGYGHTPLYADMINAVEKNATPFVTAEAGMRALELVLAIYKSAAAGIPVKFPLVDGSTTDFANRFK